MTLLLCAWLAASSFAADAPAAPAAQAQAAPDPLKALAKEQRKRREAFRKKQKQEASEFEATLAGKPEDEAAKLRADHVARAKAERKAFHKQLKLERDALRRQ